MAWKGGVRRRSKQLSCFIRMEGGRRLSLVWISMDKLLAATGILWDCALGARGGKGHHGRKRIGAFSRCPSRILAELIVQETASLRARKNMVWARKSLLGTERNHDCQNEQHGACKNEWNLAHDSLLVIQNIYRQTPRSEQLLLGQSKSVVQNMEEGSSSTTT